MPQYKIRPGRKFGHANQYKPGDVIELTEAEAAPLLGETLDLVKEETETEFGTEPVITPQIQAAAKARRAR